MASLATEVEGRAQQHGLIEEALVEFGLMEAFALRSEDERARCLRWVSGAEDSTEARLRIAQLLDALYEDQPLPGATNPSWDVKAGGRLVRADSEVPFHALEIH